MRLLSTDVRTGGIARRRSVSTILPVSQLAPSLATGRRARGRLAVAAPRSRPRGSSIDRIAPGALQCEQQESADDRQVLVEMRHVGAARGPLHVPEIVGKVDDEDEVDGEQISDPASLEADQDRKA